jgi:hypothetical protein
MLDGKGTHAMNTKKTKHVVMVVCVSILTMIGLVVLPAVATAEERADGRSLELVSPADKNGGEVMSSAKRTRAAADGSAVDFASLTGFADVQGTGIANDYMSIRTAQPGTNGWVTHAITPKQDPMTYTAVLGGAEPFYVGDFSPDLSAGIFSAWSPLTNDPNVANVENLYARHDLRTPGTGTYELDTGCPLCETTSTPLPPLPARVGAMIPLLAGASADFSHTVFESILNLTGDAPPQPAACATDVNQCYARVYESDHGVVRLAGILPNGSAAQESIAGTGAGTTHAVHYTPHVMSNDGRRVIFTVPGVLHKPSQLAPGAAYGRLYMRVDGSSTIQLDASERTDCANPGPCTGTPQLDPKGEWASTYQDASVDGTHVFFSTRQALTDNAPSSNEEKLYVWDANAPPGHHLELVSVDHNHNDGADLDPATGNGVVGASDTGDYVYFIATGQLVAGAPTLGSQAGLYVWHKEGENATVRYIGKLANLKRSGIGDSSYLTWVNTSWSIISGKESRVSPDGEHLLFMSSSGEGLLSAHGGVDVDQSACAGGCQTLYSYDAVTEKLQCASCTSDGRVVANAYDMISESKGASMQSWHLSHALSDDGRYVFFTTPGALVSGDVNGKLDAYVFDTVTGKVSLLSSGTDPSDSFFMDASASGGDAFFMTRQRLVGWDSDNNLDLYDARIGGGLPEPAAVLPGCAGDACQGVQTTVPVFDGPGSLGFAGSGNAPAPVISKSSVRSANTHKLSVALRACRKQHGRQRRKCESGARKRYATKASSNRRSK